MEKASTIISLWEFVPKWVNVVSVGKTSYIFSLTQEEAVFCGSYIKHICTVQYTCENLKPVLNLLP